MNSNEINELSKRIFQQNVEAGWWDDMDRCLLEVGGLIVSEIYEGFEGLRKDLMDDHLPHRKMEEVELADTLIRVLDLGGRYSLETPVVEELDPNEFDPAFTHKPSARALILTGAVMEFIDNLLKHINSNIYDSELVVLDSYSVLIDMIIYVGKLQGYSLSDAVDEKLEYNKSRADHKCENRAKENGKKF